MIEGYVNYCEKSDRWVLVELNGRIRVINELVYGIAPFLKEFDEVCGDGEYIKVSLEINLIQ